MVYVNLPEWQVQRAFALDRDNHTCQLCGRTKNLVVHHIDCSGNLDNYKPANNNLSNLQTLCKKCHPVKHKADLLLI